MKNTTVALSITGLTKSFPLNGGAFQAVADFHLEVVSGQIVSIIGPSGCGKTTILMMIAGLWDPTSGKVEAKESDCPPMVVFQNYADCLYPHLTVEGNVALATLNHLLTVQDKQKRVEAALQLVGLLDAKALYPWQLSGGMQQRVLFARALAAKPPCLLLDEPFASVDAQTRYRLEDELRGMCSYLNAAILYVTHDVDSAVYVADRLLVLSKAPAKIIAELPVDFGESRTQSNTRSSKAFSTIRGHVFEILSKQE
jgi:NitT/TauT family transport system ATP-binding protein